MTTTRARKRLSVIVATASLGLASSSCVAIMLCWTTRPAGDACSLTGVIDDPAACIRIEAAPVVAMAVVWYRPKDGWIANPSKICQFQSASMGPTGLCDWNNVVLFGRFAPESVASGNACDSSGGGGGGGGSGSGGGNPE